MPFGPHWGDFPENGARGLKASRANPLISQGGVAWNSKINVRFLYHPMLDFRGSPGRSKEATARRAPWTPWTTTEDGCQVIATADSRAEATSSLQMSLWPVITSAWRLNSFPEANW